MSSNSTHPFRLQDLPVDIIFIIINYLELCDLFLLSQTSGAMRYFAKRDWKAEINNKGLKHKLDFLSSLAYALPDRWVCGYSVCLCEVDPHDVPAANPFPWDDDMAPDWRGSYKLQPHHVQLALNYDRLGGVYETTLKKMILSTNKTTYEDTPGGSYIKYTAAPAIIGDCFHLLETWEMNAKESLASNHKWNTPILFDVCPHTYILGRAMKDPCYNMGLYDWFLYGEYVDGISARPPPKSPPGRRQIGACAFCCTTYNFLIIDAEHIEVKALHDYGSFSPPDNNLWRRRYPNQFSPDDWEPFIGFRIRIYSFHGLIDFQLENLDDSTDDGRLDKYHIERFAKPEFRRPTYLSVARRSVDPE
ncbi:Ff.00g102330.m01.CDS01 [Fusarium sp. VM40]|nr:Ff.00g102330.m01.CDS01 [Fusarium sp. VM40]